MTEFRSAEADSKYIEEVFGENGYLSKKISGYKPRPGQIQLAKTIHQGIVEGRHVIGEGPTGTGKSLAYSVPAAYHASRFGKRVLIVTANKALQEQIYRKDLLELSNSVPWSFSFAVRKGISNYLCLRDYELEKYRECLGDENLKMSEHEAVESIAAWAGRTNTGDIEDVPGGAAPWLWKYFSTDRENCDGRKCSDYEDCYVASAKAACEDADIVITNYKLFFLQLAMEAQGNPGRILPIWDVAILDEAHKAADCARDEFGTEVTFGAVYRCVTAIHMTSVRGFKKKGEVLRSDILSEAHRLWGSLAARARNNQQMLKPGDVDSQKLEKLLEQAAQLYKTVAGKLGGVTDAKNGAGLQRSNDAKQNLNMADKCLTMVQKLFFFRSMEAKGIVFFIEGSGKDPEPGEKKRFVALKSKGIEVGGYLKKYLFEKNPCVVQTSATLAIMGGKKSSFGFIKSEMGMNGLDNVLEVTVASPFDWEKNALLVIPKNIRLPSHENPKWDAEIFQALYDSIVASKGRTLGLFTSRKRMEAAAEYLRKRKLPYQIYAQYESTVRDLKKKFQEDISSVLLGTTSFSEGFDIRGNACVSVVIEKIPFARKDDPIVYGLEKAGKNWWQNYMLPRAIIDFKQRVGRLIRTESDAGVIVVLDTRMLPPPKGKGYSKQFIKSIPPLRIATSTDDIAPFLRSVNLL